MCIGLRIFHRQRRDLLKKNPYGKECAVLRILSPWSKGPAKFNKQQTPETTTGVGSGNTPYRVATANYPKRRTLWIHRAYHFGFILFIYYLLFI